MCRSKGSVVCCFTLLFARWRTAGTAPPTHAEMQQDPSAPALPQLYTSTPRLLLAFFEDAVRLLLTSDDHVTGFQLGKKNKKKGAKKRAAPVSESEADEEDGDDGEGDAAVHHKKPAAPRKCKCGKLLKAADHGGPPKPGSRCSRYKE